MQFITGKTIKYLPYTLGAFFLILFLFTLSPTVNFIDSGELAAVCSTLGIAHPTGYPLFTLIGHLFTRAPLFGSEIYTLNFICALFCVVGLLFFYKFNFMLHRECSQRNAVSKKKGKNAKNENSVNMWIKPVAVVTAVLSLGLSRNFWVQSASLEVYPLHILLLSILLYVFIKNYNKPASETQSIDKNDLNGWLLFSFLLGLSFTNHMTTIFLLPAFGYMFFLKYKFRTATFKLLLLLLVPFVLGLSVYLYLPFRASMNPLINWGDPSTLDTFRSHIAGKQYSIWVFSSLAEMQQQIKYFFKIVPADYLYLSILLSFPGIWFLFKNKRDYFYFTIILFLTCFLLAVNYSIVDIDSYFLLAYFIISVWIGFGVIWLYEIFTENKKEIKQPLILLFLIIPLIQLFNYPKADESSNYLVEDYTMNVFNSVAPGGIVISYQWDNWISASYYFQHVKGIRKDIIIIDKELCRRSWYLKQLANIYPDLIRKSQTEVNQFLAEVYNFENDLPYNGMIIEEKFLGMLNSFIDKNVMSVPVYVTNEIEKEIGRGYKRIPEGLVYRLNKEAEYKPFPLFEPKFRSLGKKGKYPDMLMSFYGIMLTNRASYENFFNHKDKAYKYLDILREIYPDFGPAVSLRRLLDQEKAGS